MKVIIYCDSIMTEYAQGALSSIKENCNADWFRSGRPQCDHL